IQFVCPDVQVQYLVQGDPMDRVIYGCPFRIYDGTYSFGNARLALHPGDFTQVAFASLHDAPARTGPHEYSRAGQTHTVFSSGNGGVTWRDEPIRGAPNGGYGETADIVMDREGRMYIAYLWSAATGNATHHGGTIGLFKAAEPATGSVTESYGAGFYIRDRSGSNPVTNMGLAYVRPKAPPPEEAMNTTEQPAATEEEYGEAARPSADAKDDRVVVTWHERASHPKEDGIPYGAWIDAAFTTTSSRNNWTRLADGLGRDGLPDPEEPVELIGPCMGASNPVAWDGMVFVACVADRGYDAGGKRSRARIGDVDVWKINPLTKTTHFVGYTGLNGGNPKVAVNEDGYFVVVTDRLDERGNPVVELSTGWFGTQMARFNAPLGQQLHLLAGSTRELLDAHVTAVAVSRAERTISLIYKEWQAPQDGSFTPPAADPDDPLGQAYSQITDYNKVILTLNACEGPIAAARLQLGTAVDATNAQAYATRPGVFNDVQDGLVWVEDAAGQELFFLAANDYGAMQFAAFNVASHSAVCNVMPPIVNVPAVPVPQALAAILLRRVVLRDGLAGGLRLEGDDGVGERLLDGPQVPAQLLELRVGDGLGVGEEVVQRGDLVVPHVQQLLLPYGTGCELLRVAQVGFRLPDGFLGFHADCWDRGRLHKAVTWMRTHPVGAGGGSLGIRHSLSGRRATAGAARAASRLPRALRPRADARRAWQEAASASACTKAAPRRGPPAREPGAGRVRLACRHGPAPRGWAGAALRIGAGRRPTS
ncbi:MAG TPA: hypothetical protein VFH47_06770, partial [Candidatus Thermoplasmatota archaeon]|nr:hypothetical protein [Candidatus Thermoplasmatota archaeon]